MNIDHLRYFDCLAQVLNYTKAAERLFITQPALSSAIKRMEKELGITLFVRDQGSSRIRLTEEGAVLSRHVAKALKSYDAGVRLALEVKGERNSTLRVGIPHAIQGHLWSRAMQEFRASCAVEPDIIIKQGYSVSLMESLRSGELDVAFASRTVGSDDMNHVLLWSQPLVAAVNLENPFARRATVSLDDLCGKEFMTYNRTSPVYCRIEDELAGVDVRLNCRCDDEITMASIVAADPSTMALMCYSFLLEAYRGIAFLPVLGVSQDFHKIYLVSRREDHPQVVSDFIAFMARYRFPITMGG